MSILLGRSIIPPMSDRRHDFCWADSAGRFCETPIVGTGTQDRGAAGKPASSRGFAMTKFFASRSIKLLGTAMIGAIALQAAPAAASVAPAAVPVGSGIQSECNRVIEIHNRARVAIYYVYISMPEEDWNSDWLAEDETISSDETRSFDINDRYYRRRNACTFDIKVAFSDGSEQQLRGVNVCSISHIDATDRGLNVEY